MTEKLSEFLSTLLGLVLIILIIIGLKYFFPKKSSHVDSKFRGYCHRDAYECASPQPW